MHFGKKTDSSGVDALERSRHAVCGGWERTLKGYGSEDGVEGLNGNGGSRTERAGGEGQGAREGRGGEKRGPRRRGSEAPAFKERV